MITNGEAILKESQSQPDSQSDRIILPRLPQRPPLKGRALERKVSQMRRALEQKITQMRRRAAQD